MTSSYSEKIMKVKTALENIFLKKNIGSSNGDKNVVTDSNGNIITEDKPSYTPTITSATSSSYAIGTLSLNGTDEIIYGKDTNSNTVGYQIRTNSMEITPTDKTYRYRLLLQTGDNNKYMPVNTSTSTAHNTRKTSTMNTREFLLGGDIRYYSSTTAIAAGSVFGATTVWQQYNITLGYSFNNTSEDLTLTDNTPVYMVVQQSSTNPSMAKLASPFYTQTLPNTEDGLLYVQLGYATTATAMELTLNHPIFHYKDGKIQIFSPNNHIHSQYSTFTGNYNDLTNKPTIPSASSTTPSADTASGSVGSGTTWAKADHTHPKSTLYAEASHSHDDRYYTESEMDTKLNGKVNTSQGTTNSGKFLKVNSSGNVACESVTIPSAYTHPSTHPASMITGLATVATSGKASDLNNDSGFLTSHNPIDSSLSSSSENAVQNKVINSALAGKSDTGHTHSNYLTSHQDISGKENTSNKSSSISTDTGSTTKYPTVKAVEDYAQPKGNYLTSHQSLTNYIQKSSTSGLLKNDGTIDTNTYLTSLPSHNHDDRYYTETEISNNYVAKSQGATNNGKFLKVSNGNVTCENVTIPSASSTTPSADVSGGAIGTGTTWAKADHQHPLSSAYATSEHNHNGVYQPVGSYLTSQDITGKQDKSNIVTSWNATLSDEKYPSEKLVKNSLDNKSNNGHEHTFINGESGFPLIRDNIHEEMVYGLSDSLIFDYGMSNALYYDKDGYGADWNNEVATMGDLPSDVSDLTDTSNTAFTPKSHASSTTAYGAASTSNYGHTKLYDGVNSSSTDLAATANAVKIAYDRAEEKAAENHTHTASEIGFTAGTVFGDAAPNITNTSVALDYVMQTCNSKANINDIPTTTSQLTNNSGFLTSHQSLTPTRVYNCTSFNSTYIDTSSTNNLSLYKLGDLYFLRYFLSTKNLVYSTTDYNINSDTIPSDYRPPGDRTFYVSTNINANGRIVIKSNGRVTISASANNQTIYTAGTLTYWW